MNDDRVVSLLEQILATLEKIYRSETEANAEFRALKKEHDGLVKDRQAFLDELKSDDEDEPPRSRLS